MSRLRNRFNRLIIYGSFSTCSVSLRTPLHSHSAIAPFGSLNRRICGSLVALRSPKFCLRQNFAYPPAVRRRIFLPYGSGFGLLDLPSKRSLIQRRAVRSSIFLSLAPYPQDLETMALETG
jgi:hypothetical protein